MTMEGRLPAAALVLLALFAARLPPPAGGPAGLPRAVWPFLLAAALVALNEMGDKSQLMALAFAARMRFSRVLAGIFLAAAAMASLAVAAGALLARVPGWQGGVRLLSAALFLLFAAFALAPEPVKTAGAPARRGGTAAVFASFLAAEMGDKTQFVTVSLAARFPASPLQVLAGAVFGFVLADSLGVFAGAVLHRHLPERALHLLSAGLFFVFGLAGVWEWMRASGRPPAACALASALAALAASALAMLARARGGAKRSRPANRRRGGRAK